MIIKCPYCGTNFEAEWEEKDGQLVIICPACQSIVASRDDVIIIDLKGGGKDGDSKKSE